MGGTFAPRFGSKEVRNALVTMIAERQVELETTETSKAPLIIFPEGSTQNNRFLLTFKRGAFTTRTTITPCVMKYSSSQFYPFNEIVHDLESIIMFACNTWPVQLETLELPPF